MKRRVLSAAVVALALPLLATSVEAASARPSPGVHKNVPQARPAADQTQSTKGPGQLAPPLNGYQQVNSDLLVDPAGQQTAGFVQCPAGTRVIGGGATISGTSLTENLNGSLPRVDKRGWQVYVNNASDSDGTFRVYAVCVKKLIRYSVVTSSGSLNPSGAQTTEDVTCPTNTVPFGGGGDSTSLNTSVNLNTSIPQTDGWRVQMNNNSANTENVFASVVCAASPVRYRQVAGTPNTSPPSTQTMASVTCPPNTVVFGGGAYSGSLSTQVKTNSSYPSGNNTGWTVYENNSNTDTTTISAWAVCGKAT